jgi:hypothetical protein
MEGIRITRNIPACTIYQHSLKTNNTLNPLNPDLNPICYLLALLAHHFLHVSRIMVKSLTLRLLMSYIYGAHILDVSRSHATTHHSRWDSSGRVIGPSQRPLPVNTQHSQETSMPRWDSNPQSQQASGRRPTSWSAHAWDQPLLSTFLLHYL